MTDLPPPEKAACDRPLDEVQPASAYRLHAKVWVYRHLTSSWRPGVVIGPGEVAVMVRYWPTDQRGEITDTLMPDHVAPREAAVGVEGQAG